MTAKQDVDFDFSELRFHPGIYDGYSGKDLSEIFTGRKYICFILKKDVSEARLDQVAKTDSLIVVLKGLLVFRQQFGGPHFALGPGDLIEIPEDTCYDLLGVQSEPVEYFYCDRLQD